MKLGLFLAVYGQLSIDQALDQAKAAGVEAVEIGPGHTDLDGWLDNPSAQSRLKDAVASRGLMISSFSAHGLPEVIVRRGDPYQRN